MDKFVSRKGRGRPFSAYLKLEKGKVGFEFEERAPKDGAAKGGRKPGPRARPAAKPLAAAKEAS